jgi:hypothetical protein
MLFLIFGVATREAPEIMNLADDWSNDGTAVSYENPLPKLTRRPTFRGERFQVPTSLPLTSLKVKKRDSLRPICVSTQETGRDLLHFLSVLRA